MRDKGFYLAFPIQDAVCLEFSLGYFRQLIASVDSDVCAFDWHRFYLLFSIRETVSLELSWFQSLPDLSTLINTLRAKMGACLINMGREW